MCLHVGMPFFVKLSTQISFLRFYLMLLMAVECFLADISYRIEFNHPIYIGKLVDQPTKTEICLTLLNDFLVLGFVPFTIISTV